MSMPSGDLPQTCIRIGTTSASTRSITSSIGRRSYRSTTASGATASGETRARRVALVAFGERGRDVRELRRSSSSCAPGRRRGGGPAPPATRRDRSSRRRPGTRPCRCRALPSRRRRRRRRSAAARRARGGPPDGAPPSAAALSISGVRIAAVTSWPSIADASAFDVEGRALAERGDRAPRRRDRRRRARAFHASARYIAPVSMWR